MKRKLCFLLMGALLISCNSSEKDEANAIKSEALEIENNNKMTSKKLAELENELNSKQGDLEAKEISLSEKESSLSEIESKLTDFEADVIAKLNEATILDNTAATQQEANHTRANYLAEKAAQIEKTRNLIENSMIDARDLPAFFNEFVTDNNTKLPFLVIAFSQDKSSSEVKTIYTTLSDILRNADLENIYLPRTSPGQENKPIRMVGQLDIESLYKISDLALKKNFRIHIVAIEKLAVDSIVYAETDAGSYPNKTKFNFDKIIEKNQKFLWSHSGEVSTNISDSRNIDFKNLVLYSYGKKQEILDNCTGYYVTLECFNALKQQRFFQFTEYAGKSIGEILEKSIEVTGQNINKAFEQQDHIFDSIDKSDSVSRFVFRGVFYVKQSRVFQVGTPRDESFFYGEHKLLEDTKNLKEIILEKNDGIYYVIPYDKTIKTPYFSPAKVRDRIDFLESLFDL